jgi:hypothetical protein
VARVQVKLRYAVALAKSRKRDDKYRGIGLLEGERLPPGSGGRLSSGIDG